MVTFVCDLLACNDICPIKKVFLNEINNIKLAKSVNWLYTKLAKSLYKNS